jgi:hypothetical protein
MEIKSNKGFNFKDYENSLIEHNILEKVIEEMRMKTGNKKNENEKKTFYIYGIIPNEVKIINSIDDNDKIENILKEICNIYKIKYSPKFHRLVYKSITLDKSKTIKFYDILNESTLYFSGKILNYKDSKSFIIL